jgi:hypothetical protein
MLWLTLATKRVGRLATVGVVAASLSLGAAGCGGESLDDVLRGLKSAAVSKKTYDALKHANDLEKRDKAVVNAFCGVTTQLADNNESLTTEEYFDRIKANAESQLGEYGSKPLTSALGKLRATYDLASINGGTAQLYARACVR